MALDSGPLPVALAGDIARVDFNTAMTQLDAAFPLGTANIGLLQITAALLGAQAVETDKIKLLAVTAAVIGAEAVERAKIKLLAVDTPQLEALAVEEAKIGALAVTNGKIGLLAVDTPQLQALAVEEAKIGALAVTNGKLGNLSISAGKLQTDCVETLKIKALNVTRAKAELGFGRYVAVPTNAWDYTIATLTEDGAWNVNQVDLSGVCPVGTIGIVLRMQVLDDAVGSQALIRSDAAYGVSQMGATTQVANVAHETVIVTPCEADRALDFFATNVVWTQINLAVVGYFI